MAGFKRIGQRSVHADVPVIGRRADGSPIYGIAGGADDDEAGDGDEEDEEDEEDEDSSEDDDSKGTGNEDDGDEDEDGDDDQPVTRAELERMERRMRAADRRADKAQRELARLKKGKGKGKDGKNEDDEEIKELRTKAEEADELREDNVALSVQLAVLSRPEAAQFHDPEDILRFLEFSDLTDADGGIDRDAVGDALAELAEKKKHLVRSTSQDKDSDDSGGGNNTRKSGRQTNSRSRRDKTPGAAALRNKYPALRQLG